MKKSINQLINGLLILTSIYSVVIAMRAANTSKADYTKIASALVEIQTSKQAMVSR